MAGSRPLSQLHVGTGSANTCRTRFFTCEEPLTVYANVALSSPSKVSVAVPTFAGATWAGLNGTWLYGDPVPV